MTTRSAFFNWCTNITVQWESQETLRRQQVFPAGNMKALSDSDTVKWFSSTLNQAARVSFKTSLQCAPCFNELFYNLCQSASHLSLCLSLHPPLRFQYLKHFKALMERLVVSRDTHLPQTCHEWNNWILFGGIYYEERSCAGRGTDIKEQKGAKVTKSQADRESKMGNWVWPLHVWK